MNEVNTKRNDLITTVLLMLDESMSAWRPKTTKLGGLPHLTHEPRKPIPLGTMFRNSADCWTRMLKYYDVVQKEFSGEKTKMPDENNMPAHVVETMRQVKNSKLRKCGWVGGGLEVCVVLSV